MLHSSPIVIFRLLLVHSPPPLSNSGIVGSKWLEVMARVVSEFGTKGNWEGTIDIKPFWLIGTRAGVFCPG